MKIKNTLFTILLGGVLILSLGGCETTHHQKQSVQTQKESTSSPKGIATVKRIEGDFRTSNILCHTDTKGDYVHYEWSGKGSENGQPPYERCDKYVIEEDKLKKEKIPLSKEVVQISKKSDVEVTWQGEEGTFYFIGKRWGRSDDANDQIRNTFLYQVDTAGKLIRKQVLNEVLYTGGEKVNIDLGMMNCSTASKRDGLLLFSYTYYKDLTDDADESSNGCGIAYFDMKKGEFVRQINGVSALSATDSALAGVDMSKSSASQFGAGLGTEILVADMPAVSELKKQKTRSGTDIYYGEVDWKASAELPQEEKQVACSMMEYGNELYLMTAAGYYRIDPDTAKAEKIASVDQIDFLHKKVNEDDDDWAYEISIAPVTEKSFYIKKYWTDTGTKDDAVYLCEIQKGE